MLIYYYRRDIVYQNYKNIEYYRRNQNYIMIKINNILYSFYYQNILQSHFFITFYLSIKLDDFFFSLI